MLGGDLLSTARNRTSFLERGMSRLSAHLLDFIALVVIDAHREFVPRKAFNRCSDNLPQPKGKHIHCRMACGASDRLLVPALKMKNISSSGL